MKQKLNILHLEDSIADAELVHRVLEKGNIECNIRVVSNKKDYELALREFSPDLVLSDHSLPSFNSTEALEIFKSSGLKIPFILVTATVSEDFAVNTIKAGADDYILKDRLARLPSAIEHALDHYSALAKKENAEETIQLSEVRLREAQAIAQMGNWEIDLLTNIHTWSDELYHLFRIDRKTYTPSEEMFLSFIHPDDREMGRQQIATAFETLQNSSFQFRFIRKDGELRYGYTEWRFAFGPGKQPLRLYGIIQDITEKKQTENELQETHNKLIFHIENTPLGFIEWDKKLGIKTISKQAEKIFGWNINDFVAASKSGWSLICEEDLPWVKKIAMEMLSGKINSNCIQYRNYTEDGRIIWCEWFNSVLKDKDGNVSTIMSLVQDITHKKESELRLYQSLKNVNDYKFAIDESSIVSFTDKEGNIMHVNDKFCEISKYSREELIGQNHRINNSGHHTHAFFKHMWETITQGKVWKGEVKNRAKDGSYYWTSATIVPFVDENGEPYQYISIRTDITERKKAEADLVDLNEQLRNLMAHLQKVREEERTIIAREVHDELGQQMTSLKMEVEWIETLINDSMPEVKTRIDTITVMIREIMRSIRKIVIQLRPGILDDLGLEAALEWQAKEFEKNTGIPCHFKALVENESYPSDINTAVFRIFQESLTNILRYAQATEVYADLYEEDSHLVMVVKDNGIGISDNRINNKTSFGIMGMKERAAMLNGSFEINKLPGKGTLVHLKLPYENIDRG